MKNPESSNKGSQSRETTERLKALRTSVQEEAETETPLVKVLTGLRLELEELGKAHAASGQVPVTALESIWKKVRGLEQQFASDKITIEQAKETLKDDKISIDDARRSLEND
jgi:hypothetical protein